MRANPITPQGTRPYKTTLSLPCAVELKRNGMSNDGVIIVRLSSTRFHVRARVIFRADKNT